MFISLINSACSATTWWPHSELLTSLGSRYLHFNTLTISHPRLNAPLSSKTNSSPHVPSPLKAPRAFQSLQTILLPLLPCPIICQLLWASHPFLPYCCARCGPLFPHPSASANRFLSLFQSLVANSWELNLAKMTTFSFFLSINGLNC